MSNEAHFDDDEVESEQDQDVNDLVAELLPQVEPEDLNYMGEVDKRLEIASHYRQLMRAPLFSGGGPIAQIVEQEIRTFVVERLHVLLAITSDSPKAPQPIFDEEEMVALKMIAAKVRPRTDSAPSEAPVKAAAPTIRLAPPPAPPTTPTVAARPRAQAPAIKPAASPATPKLKAAPAPSQEAPAPAVAKAIKAKAPVGKTGRKPFPTNPQMFERAQLAHAAAVQTLNDEIQSRGGTPVIESGSPTPGE